MKKLELPTRQEIRINAPSDTATANLGRYGHEILRTDREAVARKKEEHRKHVERVREANKKREYEREQANE